MGRVLLGSHSGRFERLGESGWVWLERNEALDDVDIRLLGSTWSGLLGTLVQLRPRKLQAGRRAVIGSESSNPGGAPRASVLAITSMRLRPHSIPSTDALGI